MAVPENSTGKTLGPRKLLELIGHIDGLAVEYPANNAERQILEGVSFALRAIVHHKKGDTMHRDAMLMVASRHLGRMPNRRRGNVTREIHDIVKEYA